MEALTNNSLKEYYVKLLKMYRNAVNMITAMNQSLSTSASEVSVTMVSDDDTETTLRIPSMLYLENKVEQLENNFSNLFSMPDSGEAWFTKSADMYKLELITSGTSPVVPTMDTSSVYASITDNNFLKDLVSPKTFLKINVTNLPDNIEQLFMRKIVFHSLTAFNTIKNAGYTSYDEYVAALYNLTKGVDYDEYDSTIDVPIKCSVYNSSFKIVDIPTLDSGNPWIDQTTVYSTGHEHLSYQLQLDNLTYTNAEDSSIEFTLKAGDYIALNGKNAIYKVKSVNVDDMTVIIEESVGHIALQTYDDNSAMEFSIYVNDYSNFHYAQVPLEEDEYIAIFLGCIYNGTRSLLSTPYLVDLASIYMYDENGKKILDSTGAHMTYTEYYDTYCTNIGDLLTGITTVCQPQVSSVQPSVLNILENNATIQSLVSQTINTSNILQVLPINKHLIENTTTENIINLNAQKAEINAQLTSLQTNIDNVYSKLVSTDFSQEVATTQESLQSQLNDYYAQRTELNKQLIAIIDNINSSSDEVTIAKEGTKYRVRGITDTSTLDAYLQNLSATNIELIGMECQYKYKSITKDTTTLTTINSNVFTDWNKLDTIDKQRKLVFNTAGTSYAVRYIDYGTTQNIIKWNQIDIPITQGEDVVIRIRYKYNIGQPFINIFSPWSNEITMSFPAEYDANSEINTILATNENDSISARFTQTLINNGYEEHINNSLKVNNNTFYHMPENIYSGFNTSDNNYISLKDKLQSMSTDIDTAKDLINSELNKKYTVYLQYDSTTVELFNNSVNKINIYNSDHISDSFVKKEMNLIIKNTGDVNVKFYSIFPGNVDIPLLLDDEEFYEQYLQHYERVPLFINEKLAAQTLGQWIYFREDNPYTGASIYYDNEAQDLQDYRAILNGDENVAFTSLNTYMRENYMQCMLGYRRRTTGEVTTMKQTLIGLDFSTGVCEQLVGLDSNENEELNETYASKTIDFFKYTQDLSNNYLLRFEDISALTSKDKIIYLDNETSMSAFISENTVSGLTSGMGTFIGAFLYPDIESKTTILTKGDYNSYKELAVGKSISVPITFEYYIDGETITNITKALYFDLRDSLMQNPVHYMLELTANYDYTSTGDMINTTSLQDEATL